jgi:tetratricopeptide (TPR) repeat protein
MNSKTCFLLSLVLASTQSLVRADDARWKKCDDAGWLHAREGRLPKAREMLDAALKDAEGFGKSDPRLGLTLAHQAWLSLREGKPVDAMALAGRAREILDNPSEKETSEEARGVNVLAMLAQEQKKNAEAEKLFKRALAIEEKRQGRNDPIVAQVISNLGTLYQSDGRYAEAEKAFQRALDIRQTAFGNNADTAVSLSQLGALAHERGRSAEAEPFLKKALEIRQKELPADHPDLVLSQNNLATLYADRGKYAEAEPLFRKALEARERTLGPDHLKVAAISYNLARMYKDEAKADKEHAKVRLERAALYGDRALKIREKSAKDSLELAASQELMARIQAARVQAGIDKSMNEAAVDYLKSALAIREKAQGRDHRDVGITALQLANTLRDRDKPKDAEPYYKQALALAEKYYGNEHSNVAAVLEDYAVLLDKMKDRSAQQLRDRAKDIRAKAAKKTAATK